jgi:hypothetical protein
MVNGARVDKRPTPKQRVPSADEFPVLTGSTTPPSRSPGLNGSLSNGHSGPTAAQVLQAPPPARIDGGKERSESPESVCGHITPLFDLRLLLLFQQTKPEPNGYLPDASQDTVAKKLPISFATVAVATSDTGKEVAVSA